MSDEIRNLIFDNDLKIEAYSFKGAIPSFPAHFHEHYSIGYVEKGERMLCCKNKEYLIDKGSIVFFNPNDSHSCIQASEDFEYKGINIPEDIMLDISEEITKNRNMVLFSENVFCDDKILVLLKQLYNNIVDNCDKSKKENTFLLLLSLMLERYRTFDCYSFKEKSEIDTICDYMKKHYSEHICLNQLCKNAGFSKSSLSRAFVKFKGITPYRYLESIRINEARKLLEKGISPIECAAQTGFSDQSHFTNYFNGFIGFTPGAYRTVFIENISYFNNKKKEEDK